MVRKFFVLKFTVLKFLQAGKLTGKDMLEVSLNKDQMAKISSTSKALVDIGGKKMALPIKYRCTKCKGIFGHADFNAHQSSCLKGENVVDLISDPEEDTTQVIKVEENSDSSDG